MSQNWWDGERDFQSDWEQEFRDCSWDLSKELIQKSEPSFSGVRHSNIPKELPAILAVERNLIKVPICVMHAKSAKAQESKQS